MTGAAVQRAPETARLRAPQELESRRPESPRGLQALLVDLHDFARYPTLTIGYLVASLRAAGIEVDVLSPLARRAPALERERAEGVWDQFQRRLYHSTLPAFLSLRDRLHRLHNAWSSRPDPRYAREVIAALQRKPDVLLLSVYLDHYRTCVEIGAAARELGIPVLVGGAMFRIPEVAEAWTSLPGLAAVVGAEVERELPDIVHDLVQGKDLLQHPGVFLPGGRRSRVPARRVELDVLPAPDFRDYPWSATAPRVIPVMASRGCQWSRCTFCSDVVTANGAKLRSRRPESVLRELRDQADRYRTTNFIFLDIKLNSDVALWRGLIAGIPRALPGAAWIGTVHVDSRRDNGLGAEDLTAARAAGMTRISFGLETGSQRLLDAMDKDCEVGRNARFVREAHRAGISVRATMMLGYPGETAEDLEATAAFLERQRPFLDRVRMNRFKAIPGTPIHAAWMADASAFPGLRDLRWDHRHARAEFVHVPSGEAAYRRVKRRVLRIVHDINRKQLSGDARAFDGLM